MMSRSPPGDATFAAETVDTADAENTSGTDPDANSKSATSSASVSPSPRQPLHPGTVLRSQRGTKIKVEASLTRDLCIFFVFVGIMITLTVTIFSGVGHADEELVKRRIEKVQNGASKKRLSPREQFVEKFGAWTKALSSLANRSILPTEEDRCGLYLADSSIPDAGFGLFAGKRIGEGSIVIDAGALLPIGSGSIARHQLVIKPHITASNVVIVAKPDGHGCVVAKRNIQPGEEIFVDMPSGDEWSSYYSIFPNVPTADSYALADDILANEFKDLTRKQAKANDRKSQIVHPGRKNRVAPATGTIDQVDEKSLVVIKNIVKRFDPLAASLLPVTSTRLGLSMVSGAGMAALNNRTIESIFQQGQCFDGLTTAEDMSRGATVTRNVARGDVIFSVPLYIIAPETKNIPGDVASDCLQIGNVSALFCPLYEAHASIKHASSSNTPTAAAENECSDCANAEYCWSSWNLSREIVGGTGLEKASREYPVGLSFDIIATRDLGKGEEILLDSASLERALVVAEGDAASTDTIKAEL